MQKITQILEAKNIEFYNDGCIKSIDNTDNFLLKFNTNDAIDLNFILDENYNNNFSFSIYKDYIKSNIYTTNICIEGDSSQSFAICGVNVYGE